MRIQQTACAWRRMFQKFKRNLLETSLSADDDATVGRQFAHITKQRRTERLHFRCHVLAISCGRSQRLGLTEDCRPTGETLHSRFRAAYNDAERSRFSKRDLEQQFVWSQRGLYFS